MQSMLVIRPPNPPSCSSTSSVPQKHDQRPPLPPAGFRLGDGRVRVVILPVSSQAVGTPPQGSHVLQPLSPRPGKRSSPRPIRFSEATGMSSMFLMLAGVPSPCSAPCMLSHFSRVQLFATLWTVAHLAPLPMGFSRQEY